MSAPVDMTMKVVNFENFVVYLQVPFYDDNRCLVTASGFERNCKATDSPVLQHGWYVPRRNIEGGVAWDIDVLPRVQTMVERLVSVES